MSKPEWFRRSTWSDTDREEFCDRLKRSRGAGSKAQYLRIQAGHLAEAGDHAGAIELLDRMLTEFPEKFQLAMAHAQKAESLAKLSRIEAAIEVYRAALQAEREFPTVRTNAWLDFAQLVVEGQMHALYSEASQILQEFREEGDLKLPALEYRYAAIQASLADARGDKACAAEFARQALVEADKDHSGLRYHPTVGLVGSERDKFESRLRALARS
ncbi:MAG: hypothetical protein FJ271_08965 [Planctomycetes bacterium]|nr:hypothetical protein [Planctomycetota bacterium]